MSHTGEVQTNCNGGRLTITISHPPNNLLNEPLIQSISQALEQARCQDEIKLIRIRSGVPGVFSRGFDYEERTEGKIGPLIVAFGHLLTIMNEVTGIVLCEVDGACLGGSLELATFCDMVLTSDKSTFGHPEVHHGIFPPVAAALYPHLMGRNRTIELLATGRELSAAEAFEYGLVNRVIPRDMFSHEVEKVCDLIESNSALTLRLTKKAIESALYEKVLVAMRTTENIYLNELLPSHDAREGIQAVLDGRSPRWKNS
ncbi:enoyl-CoA hydratase/isomerase family protein [bacterium]|nr:enoyl-CoA hydratase/isomerase family protein [bacterium]